MPNPTITSRGPWIGGFLIPLKLGPLHHKTITNPGPWDGVLLIGLKLGPLHHPTVTSPGPWGGVLLISLKLGPHSGINASPSAPKMQNYNVNVQTCRRVKVEVNAANKHYMMIECALVLDRQLTAATKTTRKQNRSRCGLFGNDAKPLSLALFMRVYQLFVV